MATGDAVIFVNTALGAASYLDLQPSSGVEVVVQTIDHETDIEVYAYDGTASKLVAAWVGAGSEFVGPLRVTNSERYRIKNTTGSSAYVRAVGVQTK